MSSSNTQAQASERAAILTALDAWIRQRPGLDPRDYGSGAEGWRAYSREVQHISKQLRDARELLRAVELRPSIDAAALRAAFSAYSGRLTWRVPGECRVCGKTEHTKRDAHGFTATTTAHLDYCTGQYWPTEYRAAACAVLASALWAYWRAGMTPDGKRTETFSDGIGTYEVDTYNGLRFADAVQKVARRELSRGVVSRWVR